MAEGGTAVEKGALLMKGRKDLYGIALATISYAFLLFIVSTAVEHSDSARAHQIWYILLSSLVLLYFFRFTRGQIDYLLYENGLRLRNKYWRKDAYYPFELLEEARPGRSAKREGERTVYHDYLILLFKDGRKIRFGVGDIEYFYVFRNALLEQIGYFDEEDQGE